MSEDGKITRRQLVVGAIAAAGLAACDHARSPSGAPATTAPPSSPTSSGAPANTPASTAPPVTPTAVKPAARPPAQYVNHGSRTSNEVALTFHASGDKSLAQQLLDLLAAHHTAVTIFGVGQWLAANPDLVTRMMSDGHELANHTQSHQSMGQLAPKVISQEIVGCAEILQSLTGSISPWFRPSGIEVPTPAILSAAGTAGYPVSVGYDVDSLDFQDPGVAAIKANVAKNVTSGSIVSLHFGHRGTIDALPGVLDHLTTNGLRHVTVGQLLA